MSRSKRTDENTFLTALLFVSQVQPKRSAITAHTHCRLFGNQLSACGPVLSAAVGIQEEIECCPDTQKTIEALRMCPDAINLTMLPTRELSIKSGNFHATIPCCEQADIPPIASDPKQQAVEMHFQQALEKVGSILNARSKLILYSSAVLLDGSVIGTSGDVILEAWHGCPSPNGLIVPKLFIKTLHRIKGKSVYCLGWSTDTLTAWFPDGSWLRTRLHHDPEFPNLQQFLSLPGNFAPAPLGLWAAIDRLAPFSNDGRIYFRSEGLCTDRYETDGAINLCDGLPTQLSFEIAALQSAAPFAEKLAFNITDKMTYFQGQNVRGALSQRVEQ